MPLFSANVVKSACVSFKLHWEDDSVRLEELFVFSAAQPLPATPSVMFHDDVPAFFVK